MFKHILLPTDGSELAERAVLSGIEFARSVGASVTAVHVSLEGGSRSDVDVTSPASSDTNPRTGERDVLLFVAGTAADYGVPCETVHVKGETPFEGIIQTALDQGCDLIWMASHGRGGLAAVLLGSITTDVLTHSKIPVLVYR